MSNPSPPDEDAQRPQTIKLTLNDIADEVKAARQATGSIAQELTQIRDAIRALGPWIITGVGFLVMTFFGVLGYLLAGG